MNNIDTITDCNQKVKASPRFYFFCAGKHWDNDQLYQLRLLDFKCLQKQHRHINNISHKNLNKIDTLKKSRYQILKKYLLDTKYLNIYEP